MLLLPGHTTAYNNSMRNSMQHASFFLSFLSFKIRNRSSKMQGRCNAKEDRSAVYYQEETSNVAHLMRKLC